MDEATSRKWDVAIKAIGLIALVVSGSWTWITFRADRHKDLDDRVATLKRDDMLRRQELNKYIFERQSALYFEAARVAATIATSRDPTAVKAATGRFYELYFGELVIVEDRRVELAMISFESCLGADGCSRRQLNQDGVRLDQDKLVQEYGPPSKANFSLELAACIRTALQQDRNIMFGNTVNAQTKCPYD